jgi:hypothetical protein
MHLWAFETLDHYVLDLVEGMEVNSVQTVAIMYPNLRPGRKDEPLVVQPQLYRQNQVVLMGSVPIV